MYRKYVYRYNVFDKCSLNWPKKDLEKSKLFFWKLLFHCFTGHFRLPKFENRGCRTGNFPYGFPTVRIALREPKNGYATMIFRLR